MYQVQYTRLDHNPNTMGSKVSKSIQINIIDLNNVLHSLYDIVGCLVGLLKLGSPNLYTL